MSDSAYRKEHAGARRALADRVLTHGIVLFALSPNCSFRVYLHAYRVWWCASIAVASTARPCVACCTRLLAGWTLGVCCRQGSAAREATSLRWHGRRTTTTGREGGRKKVQLYLTCDAIDVVWHFPAAPTARQPPSSFLPPPPAASAAALLRLALASLHATDAPHTHPAHARTHARNSTHAPTHTLHSPPCRKRQSTTPRGEIEEADSTVPQTPPPPSSSPPRRSPATPRHGSAAMPAALPLMASSASSPPRLLQWRGVGAILLVPRASGPPAEISCPAAASRNRSPCAGGISCFFLTSPTLFLALRPCVVAVLPLLRRVASCSPRPSSS